MTVHFIYSFQGSTVNIFIQNESSYNTLILPRNVKTCFGAHTKQICSDHSAHILHITHMMQCLVRICVVRLDIIF